MQEISILWLVSKHEKKAIYRLFLMIEIKDARYKKYLVDKPQFIDSKKNLIILKKVYENACTYVKIYSVR